MTDLLSRVRLRVAVPDDHEFLVAVYAASRARELDQVAWPPGQRDAFVRMQYDAQDRHYRAAHPRGRFDVVEVEGRPAGRLYVDVRPDDVRIVDIALLPEHRGRGIGSALIAQVLAEAAEQGRTASIHVEVHNPAGALYERLGFRAAGERGVHRLLVWSAGDAPTHQEEPMSDLSRRAVLGASATGLAGTVVGVGAPAALAPAPAAAAPQPITRQPALYRRGRFAKRRTRSFRVTGPGVRTSMKLVAVTDLSSGGARGSLRSFELTFRARRRGPGQGTYTVSRSAFAATSLFLVPTDDSRRTYRAVVNNR